MALVDRVMKTAIRFAADEARGSSSKMLRAAADHAVDCEVAECDATTLGAACSQCSRPACTDHIFLTVTLPPVFVCAECIATEFEVVRENGEPDVVIEPLRRRARV